MKRHVAVVGSDNDYYYLFSHSDNLVSILKQMSDISLPKVVGSPEWSVEESESGSANVLLSLQVVEAPVRSDKEPATKAVAFTVDPSTLEVVLNGMNRIKEQLTAM